MNKMVNVKSILFLLATIFVSILFRKIFEVSFWITLIMFLLWLIFLKLNKYKWIVFPFLIVLVLFLNRLISFNINNQLVSFDWEQSFLGYPGISKSIDRYYNEGLIIPYAIRKLFYGQYLLILPWINNFLKQISPVFFIRLLGFSGFYLFLLGLIDSIKNKKNYWIIFWLLLVIFTGSLRVLGDSSMVVYTAIPSFIYLILVGLKSKFFNDFSWIWFLLLLVDFLLR